MHKAATPMSDALIAYRLDRNEAVLRTLDVPLRSIQATTNRIEAKLEMLPIRLDLSRLSSMKTFYDWNVIMIAAIAAAFIAMGAMFLASAANQLSAFQAGLSALQAAAPKQ